MIDVEHFTYFLHEVFGSTIVYFERFKPDLLFFEIDCLDAQDKKISIEVSSEFVKLSCVDKKPSIDFSLHDYTFHDYEEAKDSLLRIKKTRIYIPPSQPK